MAVEWEDITAYSRTAIPEDFEPYRLRKLTCGILWKETAEYVAAAARCTMYGAPLCSARLRRRSW